MADTKKSTATSSKKSTTWFQRHDQDTWSPEYQIHLITERISTLQEHLKSNHKDVDAKRTLLRLVAKRRMLLRYLKDNDLEVYMNVAKATGLKI